MKIYLAGRFMNKGRLQAIRNELAWWGHTVTSRWLDGDAISPPETAQIDLDDIDAADVIVVLVDKALDGERPMQGSYIEFGYALGKGKAIILIEEWVSPTHIFFDLPQVTKVDSVAEFFAYMECSEQTL